MKNPMRLEKAVELAKLWNEVNLSPASFTKFREQLQSKKGGKSKHKISFGKFYKRLESFLAIEAPEHDKEISGKIIEFVEWDNNDWVNLDSLEMLVSIVLHNNNILELIAIILWNM